LKSPLSLLEYVVLTPLLFKAQIIDGDLVFSENLFRLGGARLASSLLFGYGNPFPLHEVRAIGRG
jgi:hypothetical protein